MKALVTTLVLLFSLTDAVLGQIVHLKFEGDLIGEAGTQIYGVANGNVDYVNGLEGTAVKFDANSGKTYIGLGSPSSLDFDEDKDFTVQIWIKTSLDASKKVVLISNSDLSEKQSPIHANHGTVKLNKGWSLYLREGSWGFNVGDSYKNFMYEPYPGTQDVNDNEWHQIVFSHSKDENSMRVYFDGHKRAIMNVTDLTRGFGTNSVTNIGADSRGANSHYDAYDGLIDNTIIWDRPLTDDEVAEEYGKFKSIEYPKQVDGQEKLVAVAWNIWHGGSHINNGAERVAEIIKELDADFVMMQETYGSGAKIASILDYELMLAGSCWSATWGSNISVMSRYPMKRGFMTDNLPEYNGGALIKVGDDQDILVFSNWYSRNRPNQIGEVLSGWTDMINNADNVPIIWGGDFNSPSHLDGNNGDHSEQMTDAGFKDSFHEMGGSYSRIDYVYYKGESLTPTYSNMTKNFSNYPSDHPIVITEFNTTFNLGVGNDELTNALNDGFAFHYNSASKKGVLSLDTPQDGSKLIQVFNTQGQLVYRKDLSPEGSEMEVSFQNLNNGIYFLTVENQSFKVAVR